MDSKPQYYTPVSPESNEGKRPQSPNHPETMAEREQAAAMEQLAKSEARIAKQRRDITANNELAKRKGQ